MSKKIVLHDVYRHHVANNTAQSASETLFNNIKTSVTNAYTDIPEESTGSNVTVEVTIVVSN